MTRREVHNLPHIYLVGAPNCGKSTVFNRLTRAGVPVGNRPGVTTGLTSTTVRGRRIGEGCPDFLLFDLPGIRSIDPPHSRLGEDERITLDTLKNHPPDLIVNILCASTLERCLNITLSLREYFPGVPLVAAVNMCDEIERRGIRFSPDVLSGLLGVPCVAMSAARGEGVLQLRKTICRALSSRKTVGAAPRAPKHAAAAHAEGGGNTPRRPPGTEGRRGEVRAEMAARAAAASLSGRPAQNEPSDIIDCYLTKPIIGIPVLFAVLSAVFYLTFGPVGNFLTYQFERLSLAPLRALLSPVLNLPAFPPVAASFIGNCLIGGVGAVVSFMPRIVLMFVLLSILEDSGYIPRAAFVLDPILRRAGLSGQAFIPVLLGFGCSVSGIMAARTIADRHERMRCAAAIPVLSCSARAPVYALISSAFFPYMGWLAVLGVYLLGIIVFLVSTTLSAATEKNPGYFISELPPFRLPGKSTTLFFAWRRTREFLARAGGIIFLSSVAVWVLMRLSPRFSLAVSPEESILAAAAGFVAPIFAPLGFGNWQAAAALFCGAGAKEGIISALGVILGGDPSNTLVSSGILNHASALSFMVFSSMYVPCSATIPVMLRELRSKKYAAAVSMLMMFSLAYLLSLAVYLTANFINACFS